MGALKPVFISVAQEPVFVLVAQAAGVFASPQLSHPYFPLLNHPAHKKEEKF